jgi:hypothetical protein
MKALSEPLCHDIRLTRMVQRFPKNATIRLSGRIWDGNAKDGPRPEMRNADSGVKLEHTGVFVEDGTGEGPVLVPG